MQRLVCLFLLIIAASAVAAPCSELPHLGHLRRASAEVLGSRPGSVLTIIMIMVSCVFGYALCAFCRMAQHIPDDVSVPEGLPR